MHTFHPFSLTHAAVITCFALLVTWVIVLRRRAGRTPGAARIDRALAAAAATAFVVVNAWPLLPGNFDLAWSLPLHVCDIATLCVPLALATHSRTARALLYFWGLGLSTQGFITPDLQDGPARVGFWMFWLAHYFVVGGALYDVAGRGYRPTWADYRLSLIIGLIYIAIVLPLDIAAGVNYGYVGPGSPGQPTIVDVLGPWPRRVGLLIALGALATALLMLPWELSRRYRVRSDPTTRPQTAGDAPSVRSRGAGAPTGTEHPLRG